jgi:hypothetical protein
MEAKKWIQLDIKNSDLDEFMKVNIYIDGSCYSAFMPELEYNRMLNDGCFIRDGKTLDSANVRNTTNMFYEKDEDI